VEASPTGEDEQVSELLDETADETTTDEPEQEPSAVPEEPETGGDDAEPDEPDEPEAVTHGPSEVEMEKTLAKIERSATTYRNRVADLLGEQANDLSPCPLCSDGIMGHLFPVEWITPTDETQARLLEVLKTPQDPEYRPAPNVRRCGTCDGWGSVLSGSRVAGKARVMCPTCKGNGFQGEVVASNPPAPANGEVIFEPAADAVPLVSDDMDIWGSPKVLDDGQDNPNYGKMPQYKNPQLP